MQDKIDKCRKDVDSSREKYKAALSELNSYNRKYTEDMMEVFNRAQDSEEKRLVFFKEMLFGVQKCLDLSDSSEYKQIHHQLLQTISQADYSKDLKWWAQNHGSDMPMNWPLFEEYTPDLHEIVKRRKHNELDEGITLRKINMDKHHSEFPEYSPEMHDISKKQKKGNVSGGDGITLTAISTRENSSPNNAPPAYDNYSVNNGPNNEPPSYQSNGGGQNPFGDEEWEEYPAPEIDESNGVPVRALYDYNGQEDDELTFKAGDIFLKLLDADEQGWCTGKKDSKTGLYPNNYVETV